MTDIKIFEFDVKDNLSEFGIDIKDVFEFVQNNSIFKNIESNSKSEKIFNIKPLETVKNNIFNINNNKYLKGCIASISEDKYFNELENKKITKTKRYSDKTVYSFFIINVEKKNGFWFSCPFGSRISSLDSFFKLIILKEYIKKYKISIDDKDFKKTYINFKIKVSEKDKKKIVENIAKAHSISFSTTSCTRSYFSASIVRNTICSVKFKSKTSDELKNEAIINAINDDEVNNIIVKGVLNNQSSPESINLENFVKPIANINKEKFYQDINDFDIEDFSNKNTIEKFYEFMK